MKRARSSSSSSLKRWPAFRAQFPRRACEHRDRRRGRTGRASCCARWRSSRPTRCFGLYQGTPLTERRWDYGNTLPDRILLFQGPHEREAEDEDDLIVVDRRDADPRDRPLLRVERGGDRGDRGEVLARRGLTDDEVRDARPRRHGRASASASTSRARLGRQGRSRHRAGARRHLPRDRPGPRRADAPARRRGPGGRRRSKSTAIWPRSFARTAPRNLTIVEGDFLEVAAGFVAQAGRRSRLRVAGNLPYNVASPILFKLVELHAAGTPTHRRHGHAAARGRRPAPGAPGIEGLRRADAC